MKVVKSDLSCSWLIVADEYGAERTCEDGTAAAYMPLPLARVPFGVGRTSDAARDIAQTICDLLDARDGFASQRP